MEHFIIGLDKMCLMSDAHGNLYAINAADKEKHEKLLHDCRVSITVVRIGMVVGTTGLTFFLLKGKVSTNMKKSFSDAVLMAKDLAYGSTTIFTDNAFVTDDA